MLPTCRWRVVTTQDFAPILARWAGVANTKLKMSGPFVSAWADILISRQKPDQPKCVCRNILWYGSYIHTDTHPHALNAFVIISGCWLLGCKALSLANGRERQRSGNWVFRWLGLTKKLRLKLQDLSSRDLQKPLGEFKNIKFLLVSKWWVTA